MTIEEHVRRRPIAGVSRPVLGVPLAGLSGVGPVGYGLMFLIRNFAGSSSRGLPRGTWGDSIRASAALARRAGGRSCFCP